MGQAITRGFNVLVHPSRTWEGLRNQRDRTEVLLMAYALVFAVLPFLGRALGHLMMDWEPVSLLLDAILYPMLCLGLVLALGFGLGAAAPRLAGVDDRTAALHLALYASTPLWIAGLLYVVPVAFLHTVFPFLGIAWTGWLLFTGVHEVLGVRADRSIPWIALLFALFTLGFVVATQVVLTHMFTRG